MKEEHFLILNYLIFENYFFDSNAVYNKIVMLDEYLGVVPLPKHTFYFQVVPQSLNIVGNSIELPAQGTAYKFSIHKGKNEYMKGITDLMRTSTQ